MIETLSPSQTADTSESRLVARHLQKSYGSRMVVHDVSISVKKGEVVGLLGPNGAGKTTSFYMIVGLVRADAGSITIDGQPVAHLPIHRRSRLGLSYLPQEASIFRKLNVEDNVRAVLELQRDDLGALPQVVQIVRPLLHHGATLLQELGPVVGVAQRIRYAMGQLVLDDFRRDSQFLVKDGSGHGPHAGAVARCDRAGCGNAAYGWLWPVAEHSR